MAPTEVTDPRHRRRRRAVLVAFCFAAAAVLAWLTWSCLFTDVVVELPPEQMRGGRFVQVRNVPLPPAWAGEVQLRLTEDGLPLGPRVADEAAVRGTGGGAFAVTRSGGLVSPTVTTLHLSASDGTGPALKGRRYLLSFPRRQLPAAVVLLLAAWLLLPTAVLAWWRGTAAATAPGVAAWAVVVGGTLYSLFVVQAWLPADNGLWLVAVAAVALVPALGRLAAGDRLLPEWLPWVAALLGWAVASASLGSSYAAPAAAAAFLAVAAGGLLAHRGLAGVLADERGTGASLLLALFVIAAGLTLARDAGFEPAGFLGPPAGSPRAHGQVNLWTTKFSAHWILALGWATVAAVGGVAEGRRRRLAVVALLGSATLAVNGSRSALLALVVSLPVAAAALRWPTLARRSLVAALVVGVLSAPAWAGLPWALRDDLPVAAGGGFVGEATMEARGGIWEYSRRLIATRPLAGWGFGASENLPGRGLTIAEALGVEATETDTRLGRHPALAGGHPHDAALLTWLDLGLVGALLLGGLVVAVGAAIAGARERPWSHAALLGLLTATAALFALNYPAWKPEVASIVWASAVVAAAGLPRRGAGRRVLIRSTVAALVVLGLGCALLVQRRALRSWTAHDLRRPGVVLDLETGRLLAGDDASGLRIAEDLDAGAEVVGRSPAGGVLVRGWAYPPDTGGARREPVLLFVGSELAAVTWPERPSPEVYLRTEPRDMAALTSGFVVRVDPERVDLADPVTIVALGPDRPPAHRLPPLVPDTAGDRPRRLRRSADR